MIIGSDVLDLLDDIELGLVARDEGRNYEDMAAEENRGDFLNGPIELLVVAGLEMVRFVA